MKHLLASTSLALSLLAASVCTAQERPFNPSGYFVPAYSQTNSSNVRWILVESDYPPGSAKSGPFRVELRIGNEERWLTFYHSSLTLSNDRITFTTKKQNGLVYEFYGQFFPNKQEKEDGGFDWFQKDLPTKMRGTLKTKRNGKLIKSERISFYYTPGD